MRIDDRWQPTPYLAERWSVSDDARSITLFLRKDAVFHDGRPVTSEDVQFSVEAVRDNHPFKTMFGPVNAVTLPDRQQDRLDEEAERLAALLESARTEARASGIAVHWTPASADTTDGVDFRFVGLPPSSTLPTHWLAQGVSAEIVGARSVVLGPEPVLPASTRVIRMASNASRTISAPGSPVLSPRCTRCSPPAATSNAPRLCQPSTAVWSMTTSCATPPTSTW
jgi:hypothetical protein